MNKTLTFLVAILITLNLVGCSNMSKQDVGTVSGGVLGGLVGSQFGGGSGQLVAIGLGAVAGAFIGGAIGKNMDDTDRLKMSRALETQPVGQPAYWKNDRTGASYTVVPTRNVTVKSNKYCREYRTTADVAGKQQQVYGTACRQPDGSWKIAK